MFLQFAGIATHTASTILQLINWDGLPVVGGSGDRLLFSGLATALSPLNQTDVSFNGVPGYAFAQFSGYYEITSPSLMTPVPEPSTWAAAALALAAIAWTQRRRFKFALAKQGDVSGCR